MLSGHTYRMLEIKCHKSFSCGPSSADKCHEKLVNQGWRDMWHTESLSDCVCCGRVWCWGWVSDSFAFCLLSVYFLMPEQVWPGAASPDIAFPVPFHLLSHSLAGFRLLPLFYPLSWDASEQNRSH